MHADDLTSRLFSTQCQSLFIVIFLAMSPLCRFTEMLDDFLSFVSSLIAVRACISHHRFASKCEFKCTEIAVGRWPAIGICRELDALKGADLLDKSSEHLSHHRGTA